MRDSSFADSLVLQNDAMEISLSAEGGILGLTDRHTGFTFRLASQSSGNPLWQVLLRSQNGHINVVEPSGPPEYRSVGADGLQLTMRWREPVEGGHLVFTAHATLDADSPMSSWRCEVSSSGPAALWEVVYPRLNGLTRLEGNGAKDALAIPWQYGGMVPDPIGCIESGGSRAYGISMDYGFYDAEDAVGKKDSRIAFSYPGMWSLQFMAFYNPEHGGIYYAAHDPEARYKRFGFYGNKGEARADLLMQHYPDERIEAGIPYRTPYDAMIGLFRGQWWNASAAYRHWALQQEWCSRGPLNKRSDLPQWLLDTDLWYWNWRPKERTGNHGRVKDLVPAIVDLNRRLGTTMAFHWYEWDSRRFNAQMPEVFPLNGEEAAELASGLAQLHAEGVHAIPYINGRLWTTNHPDWEAKGARLACRTPDGEVAWYDNHQGTAQICPFTPEWQQVNIDVCKQIVQTYGMDGAYIDQITSCYAVPCFADNHGHPRGGGNTWYVGYRVMMEKLQDDIKSTHSEAAFTSESTIDCYLDLFDANLAREASEMSAAHGEQWLPIPLFHSVYHDYALTYGTAMRLVEQFPDAYYYGEALVLNGGQQLMVEDYMAWDVGTGHYDHYLTYLQTLLEVRHNAHDYLTMGEWVPPVDMDVHNVDIQWSATHPAKTGVPAVITSTWRLNGSLCLILANHTASAQEIAYTLRLADYGLSPDACCLFRLEENQEPVECSLAPDGLHRRETIPARSAVAYVVR